MTCFEQRISINKILNSLKLIQFNFLKQSYQWAACKISDLDTYLLFIFRFCSFDNKYRVSRDYNNSSNRIILMILFVWWFITKLLIFSRNKLYNISNGMHTYTRYDKLISCLKKHKNYHDRNYFRIKFKSRSINLIKIHWK